MAKNIATAATAIIPTKTISCRNNKPLRVILEGNKNVPGSTNKVFTL